MGKLIDKEFTSNEVLYAKDLNELVTGLNNTFSSVSVNTQDIEELKKEDKIVDGGEW
jgi:hypothetical protein